MSTDRELLELAAKAAGIVIEWRKWPSTHKARAFFKDGHANEQGDEGLSEWSPLTDDGDALRLAVKLRLRVQCEGTTTTAYTPTGNRYCWNEAAIVEGDPYAAARRAIVRAAAEIAKSTGGAAPGNEEKR